MLSWSQRASRCRAPKVLHCQNCTHRRSSKLFRRATRAFLYINLQEKCRAARPGTTLCASLRSWNARQHVTRAILYGNLEEKCRGPAGAPWSSTGLHTYRRNPQCGHTVWGKIAIIQYYNYHSKSYSILFLYAPQVRCKRPDLYVIVCGDWMSPGVWEMLSPQSSPTPHVFGRQGMAWSSPRGICFIWIAAWPRLSWFLARSCIHGSSEPTKKACMKLSVQFEMFDLKRLSGSPVSTCHESQERTAAPHPWTTCPTLRRAARWLGCAHSTLDLTRHSLGTGDETMWGFLASWNLAKYNACWLMLNDIETL